MERNDPIAGLRQALMASRPDADFKLLRQAYEVAADPGDRDPFEDRGDGLLAVIHSVDHALVSPVASTLAQFLTGYTPAPGPSSSYGSGWWCARRDR